MILPAQTVWAYSELWNKGDWKTTKANSLAVSPKLLLDKLGGRVQNLCPLMRAVKPRRCCSFHHSKVVQPQTQEKHYTERPRRTQSRLSGFPIKLIIANHSFWSNCSPIQLPIHHQINGSLGLISEDTCVTYHLDERNKASLPLHYWISCFLPRWMSCHPLWTQT